MIGTILALVSGAAYFYFETKAHTRDGSKHIAPGQLQKYETKEETRAARRRMVDELGREHQLMLREIKADTAATVREVRRMRRRR